VSRRGSIVVDLAGGLAVVETGDSCTAGTRFQICSVSKQFTAAAVMLLVESGRVDLNEPLDRWMPEAPPQWRQVTLHQLLSHTAGVPHWLEAPDLDPADPMSVGQRVEIIQNTPLRTEPGADWHYSSPGFVLAGYIVERASGCPYQDFLAERILSPLQLSHTSLGATPDDAARGYRNAQPVTPFDLSAMCGSGDIWSTAGDLTRFTAALHGGELISSRSLRAMCTRHASIDDDDDEEPQLTTTGYGYGMFIGIFAGHAVLFHPGDNPGYQSLGCWIPDQSASIVILANDEAVSITGLLRQLLPAALEI
jgi:CubicO group peptidase (beta-lactamase class C family)